MIPPSLLDSLEQKAKSATPGPWLVDSDGDVVQKSHVIKQLIAGSYSLFPTVKDSDYISAASPDTILNRSSAPRVSRRASETIGDAREGGEEAPPKSMLHHF